MAEQKMHGFRARLDYILKHNYAINRIFNWMASSFMKVWGYFIPLDDEMVISVDTQEGIMIVLVLFTNIC